jgi:hypothetical protein
MVKRRRGQRPGQRPATSFKYNLRRVVLTNSMESPARDNSQEEYLL